MFYDKLLYYHHFHENREECILFKAESQVQKQSKKGHVFS